MIKITITGERLKKKALVYEFPGRQGRRRFVLSYSAYAECSVTKERFDFSVVRDSATQVFGIPPEEPYSEEGECPPSGVEPFCGKVREDGPVGFRIQLFETQFESFYTILGSGSVPRKHIQIHFGAACSHGCFMVAGTRRFYRKEFEKNLRRMLAATDVIKVVVHPR